MSKTTFEELRKKQLKRYEKENKYYSHNEPIYEKVQDEETGEWSLIKSGLKPIHEITQESKHDNDVKNFVEIVNNQIVAKRGFDPTEAIESIKVKPGEEEITDLVGLAKTLSEDKKVYEQQQANMKAQKLKIEQMEEALIKQKAEEEQKIAEAKRIEEATKITEQKKQS